MGTFDWDWANGGPPEAAYSRVTRDLAAVCADFVAWLDALPGDLASRHDCIVSVDDAVTTITPSDPSASPLTLERHQHEAGGTVVVVGFGRQSREWVTDCLCDACDGDSAEFIEAAEELVAVVTGGFEEFRRDGAEGYMAGERGGSSRGPGVRGEFFEVTWAPWSRRSAEPGR